MPSSKLTPAQNELLTLLAEECAEVIQAVTKIQRFGLHGRYDDGVVNVEKLHMELGDVNVVMVLLERVDVLDLRHLPRFTAAKLHKLGTYLRHYKIKDTPHA